MQNNQTINHKQIIERLGNRSLVFLGMMGCGKSTIGKMVARKLEIEFFDSDAEIEKAANLTVAEIFADYGEDEFRKLEERVINRIITDKPVVLALGGGAFLNDNTRASISKNALSVWLNVDINHLVERVKKKPGKRPLLATGDPKKILSDLMEQREPIYNQADIHVASKGKSKSGMRDHVLNKIANQLELNK